MLSLIACVSHVGAAEFCSRTSSGNQVFGWVSSTVSLAWLLVVYICTLLLKLAWAYATAKGECSKTYHYLLRLQATATGPFVRGASSAPCIATLPLGFDSKTNTPLSELQLSAAAAVLRRSNALLSGESPIAPQHRNTRCPRGCRFVGGKAALRPTQSYTFDCLHTIPS